MDPGLCREGEEKEATGAKCQLRTTSVSNSGIEEDQMIKFELLKDAGVLIVEPRDALTA